MVIWNVSEPVRSVMIIGMGVVVAAAAGALIIFVGEVGADLLGVVLQAMLLCIAVTHFIERFIAAVTANGVFPVFYSMIHGVFRIFVPFSTIVISIDAMTSVTDDISKTHQGQSNTNNQQTDCNKPFHE